jgi:hypothetical protein
MVFSWEQPKRLIVPTVRTETRANAAMCFLGRRPIGQSNLIIGARYAVGLGSKSAYAQLYQLVWHICARLEKQIEINSELLKMEVVVLRE